MHLQKTKKLISWIVPSSRKNPDRQLASVWIRALQVMPHLEDFGFKCRLNKCLPGPDVAIFLRRYSDSDVRLATKLKNKGTKIVLDVIVNYFETYPSSKPEYVGWCSKDQHDSFMRLVGLSDEIWCVSPFLKSIANRHHPNVVFISDTIDQKHFSHRKQYHEAIKPLRLGWSGVSVKASPLNMFRQWVVDGALSLCIISEKPPVLEVPYEFKKWSYKTFPKDIVGCDLCVAPKNVDNNYDRGHSLFKIGVFMAEGVPALAGPVPSYDLILRDDKGGHICRTPEEWNEYIERCLNNEDRLRKWSIEAVEQIMPYSTTNVSKQIANRIDLLLD